MKKILGDNKDSLSDFKCDLAIKTFTKIERSYPILESMHQVWVA